MNESIQKFIDKYNGIHHLDNNLILEVAGKYYGQTNILLFDDYYNSFKECGILQLDSERSRRIYKQNRDFIVKLHKISCKYPTDVVKCYYCNIKSCGDDKITILCMIEDNIYKEYLRAQDIRWRELGKPQMMDRVGFVDWYNNKNKKYE